MSSKVDDGVNPPVTTDYTWDVNRSLPVVLEDTDNRYVYGFDLIAAIDGSDAETYFLYDGLGSTTELLDDTGDVTDAYTYDVFGAIRASSGGSTNAWRFTGEQHDEDSGLYYLRARYYDQETGRFLSKDPIPGAFQHPTSQQPYVYALSNPCNRVDPSGLASEGGAYDTACAGAATGRGLGRFEVPKDIISCPLWYSSCWEKLYANDWLGILAVAATFRTTSAGTELTSLQVGIAGHTGLGWSSTGYITAQNENGFYVTGWFTAADRNVAGVEVLTDSRMAVTIAFQFSEGGGWQVSGISSFSGKYSFLLDADIYGSCVSLPVLP